MKLDVVLKSAYDQDLEVNLQEIISAEIYRLDVFFCEY